MESNTSGRANHVALGRQYWNAPLRIPLRHFKRFDRRLDRQLQKLVDRWTPLAAPQALRGNRFRTGLHPIEGQPGEL